ncbi:metallophosphoesterase family protein [Paraburkholderia aromaticivorans]|uniref:metallophosphoesterase family protein n=1 Tax=Paraburkholderia aromaticivorans TaxID=2026199 RepID=UPI00197DA562|nr:metallophosphatase family protein [Paraburkholderia aromaticivorans]
MKIAQCSDLHYSPENLVESDRCFRFAVGDAIARGADVGVISGDSTDHRLDAHAPALNALATQIHRMANAMPVLMLQGTFSHEPPGTLDNFALMGGCFDVFVADRVQQVALIKRKFVASAGAVFDAGELESVLSQHPEVVFTCLPTIHKGQLAISVGAADASTELAEVLTGFLVRAGKVNTVLRAAGVPTVGVSHGTVNGCTTEHGVMMAGFDHEFSVTALFEAQCDAFMLGHIHKSQSWTHAGQQIAYPGSIGRFHYGEEGDKGYLMWQVAANDAQSGLVATPSREMVTIDFDGPPDMERLTELASASTDRFVRVRWQIDEEHRQVVDRSAIEALFSKSAGLKLDARILPVMRSRAEGISQEVTVDRKLARWCELANVDAGPLIERLQLLAMDDPEAIAEAALARLFNTAVASAAELLPLLQASPETPASPDKADDLDWLSAGDPFAA